MMGTWDVKVINGKNRRVELRNSFLAKPNSQVVESQMLIVVKPKTLSVSLSANGTMILTPDDLVRIHDEIIRAMKLLE